MQWFGFVPESEAVKKWQWRPTFAFYEHYSNNVNLSSDTPIAGYRTQIIPAVSAILPSKRRQIKVNMNLKLDMRSQDDGLVRNLHWIALNGYWAHELSPRTSYEVSSAYDITYTTSDLGVPWFGAFGETTRADFMSFAPSLRYRISKKTFVKIGASYRSISYTDPDGADGTQFDFAGTINRKFGNRLTIQTGLNYRQKEFSNQTGYTQMTVPINIVMDLTYFKLNLGTQVLNRTSSQSNASGVGARKKPYFLWGLGFDLGGKLFKFRNTTFNIKLTNDIYEDLFGYAYIKQEFKLMSFHILKKVDIYNEVKYGQNNYVSPNPQNGIDNISYYGYQGSLKWYMTKKKSLKGRIMYTMYDYVYVARSGFADNSFTVMSMDVTYNQQVRDWLYAGLSFGTRNSSSPQPSGNYGEYFAGLFLKSSW
ncbi:MAG: hypothetical protein ACE5GM_04030 [bacterium]